MRNKKHLKVVSYRVPLLLAEYDFSIMPVNKSFSAESPVTCRNVQRLMSHVSL